MNYKLTLRETLAWIMLVVSFLLLSVTITFAQEKVVTVKSKNGKAHITISEKGEGKNISIDTTVNVSEGTDIDALVSKLSGEDSDANVSKNKKIIVQNKDMNDDSDNDNSQIIININKKEIRDEIERSMKDLKSSMKEMNNSLSKIHIHVDGDKDDKDFDFNFPDDMDKDGKKHFSHSYSFSTGDDDVDLSKNLSDENHFVIPGDDDEQAPVLEKVIKSKNGEQYFVYKRSEKVNKESNEPNVKNAELISGLSIFPNPGSGIITVNFEMNKESDAAIDIFNNSGKKIHSESLKSISGKFSEEIDLSKNEKGSYVLKVRAKGNEVSSKFVIN